MKFTILVPMAGKDTFKTSKNHIFPKMLAQVNGKLLVERAAEAVLSLGFEKKIIVAIPEEYISIYHLDKVLTLLDDSIQVCPIRSATQGAACSALLAIEQLNLEDPLIITSFDQVLDFDLTPYINHFINSEVDAGVLTFEDIHPKWSYVKTDDQGFITQAAEKMPISRNAVAGLYFFKTGDTFVEAAKEMIRNDVTCNDSFYISHTINEIILAGGKALALPIKKDKYFHFHDDHAVESFEEALASSVGVLNQTIYTKAQDYVAAFNRSDIEKVAMFFADGFHLIDPVANIEGKDAVVDYIKALFAKNSELKFESKNIIVESNKSTIEFQLELNDGVYVGTDVIEWNSDNQMESMRAYLYKK